MKKVLIIGGTRGIGSALALEFAKDKNNNITIVGKEPPDFFADNIFFEKMDISKDQIEKLKKYEVDILIITVGIGRVARFETFNTIEINKILNTNLIAILKILALFYNDLLYKKEFKCAVFTSIAGIVSSPLFAIYSASKAGLVKYIEAVNIELEKSGSNNVITNIAPGFTEGTSFYGEKTNVKTLEKLAKAVLKAMNNKEKIYIPNYNSLYKNILKMYYENSYVFGLESYDAKLHSKRINNNSLVKIGYLSGTFDLFHIGHLNLLKRAKLYCDYLVVGVHPNAKHKNKNTFIPFEERKRIVSAIDVVDEVIESLPEDNDVWKYIKYDFLFVGSDYKGSERFKKYEEYFKDKPVKIIYFPYTKGTSSTELRKILSESIKEF